MIFPFALSPLSFNANRSTRNAQNCSWEQWTPVGWMFIPNQFFGGAGKSVGLCCFLHDGNLRHKLNLQIPDEPAHAATHVGARLTGRDTNTCSQVQAICLFEIDCALQNYIPVSGSKKFYKLPTAALIDQYCHLIPASEVLFLPLSISMYRDKWFFPEGGRRHSCWCWSVKKYRKLCLFLEVVLCLLAQWLHVQK